MRELFGLLVAISFALGGTYMMWPDQFAARWNSWIALAEHQISAELATIDQIRSGKLKIGEAPARIQPLAPPQEPAPPGWPSPGNNIRKKQDQEDYNPAYCRTICNHIGSTTICTRKPRRTCQYDPGSGAGGYSQA